MLASTRRGASSAQASRTPVTVMVVDDSFFMRTLVSDLLDDDPDIAVVATASSGSDALRQMPEIRPDCVTLDLMMPGLDGLTTLKMIMTACPTPVIVLSAYGHEDADMAMRCRSAGAVSVIPKPSGEMSLDIHKVQERLRAEVKGIAKACRSAGGAATKARRGGNRELVVLGASTGGQVAVQQLVNALPTDFAAPLLIVQHAPDRFTTSSFAERLNRTCALPVKITEDGETLHGGVVYLAPGGSYVTVVDESGNLRVRHAESADGLTPSIDLAMCSGAAALGSRVRGIILSGLGDDGVRGMRAIRAAGGRTLVQDHSAATPAMPNAVIEAGLADEVLPAHAIAEALATARVAT